MAKKPPTKTSSVQAHALTKLEMRVAVEFFDQAASSYSDHSATEFTLPDTPARRELATAAMRHFERSSGNEADELDIEGDAIVSHDNVLFHYFARRWGVFVQRLEQGQAIAPPLGAEELLTAASLLEYLSRTLMRFSRTASSRSCCWRCAAWRRRLAACRSWRKRRTSMQRRYTGRFRRAAIRNLRVCECCLKRWVCGLPFSPFGGGVRAKCRPLRSFHGRSESARGCYLPSPPKQVFLRGGLQPDCGFLRAAKISAKASVFWCRGCFDA